MTLDNEIDDTFMHFCCDNFPCPARIRFWRERPFSEIVFELHAAGWKSVKSELGDYEHRCGDCANEH